MRKIFNETNLAFATVVLTLVLWLLDRQRDEQVETPTLSYLANSMSVERGETMITLLNDSDSYAAITGLRYVISDPKQLEIISKKDPEVRQGDNPEEIVDFHSGHWDLGQYVFEARPSIHVGPHKIPTVVKLKILNRHWAGHRFEGQLIVTYNASEQLLVDGVVLLPRIVEE